jgi:hypothetical protein
MASRFITEDEVDKALEWLRDNARELGAAKGRMIETNHMLKAVKAIEMKRHDGPVSKAEMMALASDAYRQAIQDDVEATVAFETLRSLREAASAKIECWRSQEANLRSMKL